MYIGLLKERVNELTTLIFAPYLKALFFTSAKGVMFFLLEIFLSSCLSVCLQNKCAKYCSTAKIWRKYRYKDKKQVITFW